MNCNGMNPDGSACTNTELIRSHIIPRGFARVIMAGHSHNFEISSSGVRVTQHGVYDSQILCAVCDGKLGRYDDYALNVLRRFPSEHAIRDDGMFVMNNVKGDEIAKFALAVLWRASLSSRPEFERIQLGPYESEARKVLFGTLSLASMSGYELLVVLLRSPKGTPTELAARFYMSPVRHKVDGINWWFFPLQGLKFMAKLDSRRLPTHLLPFVVNGNSKLIGSVQNYETTSEYRAVLKMAQADSARRRAGSTS